MKRIRKEKLGVKSWELEVGRWKLGVRRWKMGVGSRELEVENVII